MRTLKKYLWVILFNIITAAIIFVPAGMYIYNKFGFSSEVVETTVKVSVIGIFFLVIFGIYMLSAVKKWINKQRNWIVRFVLITAYSMALVGGVVYLINKLCDTVNLLAGTVLADIQALTSAIVYTSIIFLVCFILSRASAFFSAWFSSKIEDMATLKSTERAQREIEKSRKKKREKEIYLDET